MQTENRSTLLSAPSFREAALEDALNLAALLDIASRGLATWFWSTRVSPGQSPIEVGRQRIRDEQWLPSHYSHWAVTAIEDQIAGGLAGYIASDPYHAADAETLPSYYSPILQLEAGAIGTWYILALAVFPEHRNKGLGTAMLERAAEAAKKAQCAKLSVILASDNHRASKLYVRQGFSERDRKPLMPFPGSKDSGDWVLMVKEV